MSWHLDIDLEVEPGPVLRMTVSNAGRVVAEERVPLSGLVPKRVANRLVGALEAQLLAGYPATLRPGWPVEISVDAPLWARIRDAVAALPRGG